MATGAGAPDFQAAVQKLVNGEFDIAMSGVSITDTRKKIAAFSDPYHIGGKTPIARCDQKERFSTAPLYFLP